MRVMTLPSVRATPRPCDDTQEVAGGYVRRQKHNARHGVVEYHHGAVLYRYTREPVGCQNYLDDGVTRRLAHPVHMVEVQHETLEDTVILADSLEAGGPLITDRYRR